MQQQNLDYCLKTQFKHNNSCNQTQNSILTVKNDKNSEKILFDEIKSAKKQLEHNQEIFLAKINYIEQSKATIEQKIKKVNECAQNDFILSEEVISSSSQSMIKKLEQMISNNKKEDLSIHKNQLLIIQSQKSVILNAFNNNIQDYRQLIEQQSMLKEDIYEQVQVRRTGLIINKEQIEIHLENQKTLRQSLQSYEQIFLSNKEMNVLKDEIQSINVCLKNESNEVKKMDSDITALKVQKQQIKHYINHLNLEMANNKIKQQQIIFQKNEIVEMLNQHQDSFQKIALIFDLNQNLLLFKNCQTNILPQILEIQRLIINEAYINEELSSNKLKCLIFLQEQTAHLQVYEYIYESDQLIANIKSDLSVDQFKKFVEYLEQSSKIFDNNFNCSIIIQKECDKYEKMSKQLLLLEYQQNDKFKKIDFLKKQILHKEVQYAEIESNLKKNNSIIESKIQQNSIIQYEEFYKNNQNHIKEVKFLYGNLYSQRQQDQIKLNILRENQHKIEEFSYNFNQIQEKLISLNQQLNYNYQQVEQLNKELILIQNKLIQIENNYVDLKNNMIDIIQKELSIIQEILEDEESQQHKEQLQNLLIYFKNLQKISYTQNNQQIKQLYAVQLQKYVKNLEKLSATEIEPLNILSKEIQDQKHILQNRIDAYQQIYGKIMVTYDASIQRKIDYNDELKQNQMDKSSNESQFGNVTINLTKKKMNRNVSSPQLINLNKSTKQRKISLIIEDFDKTNLNNLSGIRLKTPISQAQNTEYVKTQDYLTPKSQLIKQPIQQQSKIHYPIISDLASKQKKNHIDQLSFTNQYSYTDRLQKKNIDFEIFMKTDFSLDQDVTNEFYNPLQNGYRKRILRINYDLNCIQFVKQVTNLKQLINQIEYNLKMSQFQKLNLSKQTQKQIRCQSKSSTPKNIDPITIKFLRSKNYAFELHFEQVGTINCISQNLNDLKIISQVFSLQN